MDIVSLAKALTRQPFSRLAVGRRCVLPTLDQHL